MHWLYSAAMMVGFVFVLVVGVMSVLHDLIAIDDCHLNDEIRRSPRTGGSGPGSPSHELAGGAEGTSSGLDVHDVE